MTMKKLRHKFNAKAVTKNFIRYDSKLEAKLATKLDFMKREGEVLFYLRQVPFDLPGGVKYRCDFQVFYSNGEVEFIDAKGIETEVFKIKKKILEEMYPIKLIIWKG